MRWVGHTPKLWASVLRELCVAEKLTHDNTKLTFNMCINYSGRAEIADAVRSIAREAAEGRLKPGAADEEMIQHHLYAPAVPDVNPSIRASGELRTSNFLMWESAYAELYFSDLAWPDFDRRELWEAYEACAEKDRRFDGTQGRVPHA